MLRAHPAEENTNTEFFHVIASFYLILVFDKMVINHFIRPLFQRSAA